MKKLFWQIVIFFELWRRADPWEDGGKIEAAFAWELAGIFAESDALDEFVELR